MAAPKIIVKQDCEGHMCLNECCPNGFVATRQLDWIFVFLKIYGTATRKPTLPKLDKYSSL